MSNVKSKFRAILAVTALMAVGFSPAPANAELALPKNTWPACDDFRVDYCIESIAIRPLGTKIDLPLVWYPSGTGPASAEPDSASPAVSASATVETADGRALSGRWSHPSWVDYGLDAYGYQGLGITFGPANTFTNHLFFTVLPVKAAADNATKLALKAGTTANTADLSLDDRVTVKVRIGEVLTGVSIGIANNLSLSTVPGTLDNPNTANKDESTPGILTLSGTPVPVPQVSSIRQCEGEAGVATSVVSLIQGFIVVENDGMGFGVDGLSGRMAISTNGVSCGASTPTWDDKTETLNWQAGAPHFAPDGTTVNKGFYKAIIPANDALLLWGLTDPTKAVSALTIQVTTETGGVAAVAASKISYLQGNIVVDVTGFEFSKPKIQIKKLASFKGFAKAKTLSCVDPVSKKKVTVKDTYGCPRPITKPVQSFVTNSFAKTTSTLTTAQRTQVLKWQKGFIEATTFVCTGMHVAKATSSEITLAKKRAKSVCDQAKKNDRTLNYQIDAKPTTTKSSVGKVMVTMKYES